MENEQLQFELDTLVATQAGLMAIVGSLMATHPDYEKLQLHLTGLLEILLSGEAGKTFTKKQRQQAREFVETLQHLNKAPEKIEPLAGIPKLRKKPPFVAAGANMLNFSRFENAHGFLGSVDGFLGNTRLIGNFLQRSI